MSWKRLFLEHILKRGERYYKEGRVVGLSGRGNSYSAYVDGNGSSYRVNVRLNSRGGIGSVQCSCPYAESGFYCKHIAAVLYEIEGEAKNEKSRILPLLKIAEQEILRFTTKAAYQRDRHFAYGNRCQLKQLPEGYYLIRNRWSYPQPETQYILLNKDLTINNFSCTCKEEQNFAAVQFCSHINAALAGLNGQNVLLSEIAVAESGFPLPDCHLLPVPKRESMSEKEARQTRQRYQYYANMTARAYQSLKHQLPESGGLFRIEPPEEKGMELQAYFSYEPNEYGESQPALSFKVGAESSYKIKNLSQFLEWIGREEFHRYGQKLAFTHKRSAFTEEAWRLIELLRQCSSVLPRGGAYLPLIHAPLDELFDFFSENPQILSEMVLVESEQNPELRIEPLSQGFYRLDYSGVDLALLITGKYAYRFQENIFERIFFPDVLSLSQLMELIREMPSGVYFGEELLPELLEKVKRANGELEGEPESLVFKLDLDKNSIRIRLEGDVFSRLAARIAGSLEECGCFFKNEAYYFSNIDQYWLDQLTAELAAYGEVWVSEELKAYHKVYRAAPSLHVRQKGKLLKLDIQFSDAERKEVIAMLKSFRRKKEYHRLKNGETIKLEPSSWQEFSDFMENQNILPEDLEKGEIMLPMQQLFSLSTEAMAMNFDAELEMIRERFLEHRSVEFVLSDKAEALLKDYQKEGVKFLKLLEELGLNGILADDMGLGKTLQTLCVLSEAPNKTSLVICPASLIYNWRDEAERFFPEMKAACVLGDKEQRLALWRTAGEYQLLITGYDYLLRDLPEIRDLHFHYVILDESQRIKNMQTKSARAAKQLKSEHRLALSGTPIENNLAELWSVFDFLMPSYLYSYSQFRKKLEIPIVREGRAAAGEKLKALTSPFILRRLKKDVLKELPDKVEKVFTVELNEKERLAYLAQEASVSRSVQAMLRESGGELSVEILALLTRLRLLCCDRSLVEEGVAETGSKVKACIGLVKELTLQKQQILIFSSFTKVLELLAVELKRRKISYRILQGSTPKEERHQAVQEFQTGGFEVFLISLKAGGTGLNLTEAQAVIHFDPWWNKAAMNQATDRAYRIGQRQSVSVYSMIVADSIEERIFELQNKKWELAERFIDGDGRTLKRFSAEELMELFRRR